MSTNMPNSEHLRNTRIVRNLHEFIFSMNVSTMIMAALLLYGSRSTIEALIRLEVTVHHFLHMRQTDFLEMHVALFLPGTILALLFWGCFQLLSPPIVAVLLRCVAGLFAVAIAPLWWLGENYAGQQQYGWNPLHVAQTYEMLAVVVWVLLYSVGRWASPSWVNVSILLAHSGFWIWECGPYSYEVHIANWQVGPFLGLCSSFVWLFYLLKSGAQSQRAPVSTTAQVD
jgi:hypothetical protein